MQASQDPHHIEEAQPSLEDSHGLQGNYQNASHFEAPKEVSGSASNASSNGVKVSRGDIELVQNLIERCLQLYMNRGEVVRMLSNRAKIEPGFTTLVWQKLEEENSEFFKAYYIRLKLKRQIICFNHLLEHQYHLMKYPVQPEIPLAPIQNGIRPMPANSGLQLGSDCLEQSRDTMRTLGQFWNFSLSELTADLTNLADLGVLGDYDGSPFLPSDSDILLDSPEQEDMVEEYFADVANGPCSHQSDEEKS